MTRNEFTQRWLPVLGLTGAAFIFNTSEFIPIGLLSDIAADFHTSEARVGMLISVYAWFVALFSLPLMMMVSSVGLSRLMLGTVAVFGAFQLLSSLSTGYYMLMVARMGVAGTHCIFWSIVAPLAVRISGDEHRAWALSMIVAGGAVAMVLGLPLGRIVGLYVGWRAAFFCVFVLSVAVLLYLALALPAVPVRKGGSHGRIPEILHNRPLMGIYVFIFLIVTSHYCGYSYIEPFLKQTAGLGEQVITAVLMVFGAMGIVGSALYSRYYNQRKRLFINLSIAAIGVSMLLLRPISVSLPAILIVCVFWGIAATAFNVALQSELIYLSSQDTTALAMSIYSGIFNLGIGCGTLVGGLVCTHQSVSSVGTVGFCLSLLAFACWQMRKTS